MISAPWRCAGATLQKTIVLCRMRPYNNTLMAMPKRLRMISLPEQRMMKREAGREIVKLRSGFCSLIRRKNNQESLQLNKSYFFPSTLFLSTHSADSKTRPPAPFLLHLQGANWKGQQADFQWIVNEESWDENFTTELSQLLIGDKCPQVTQTKWNCTENHFLFWDYFDIRDFLCFSSFRKYINLLLIYVSDSCFR